MNKKQAIQKMVTEGSSVWRDDLNFETFTLLVTEDVMEEGYEDSYYELHEPMWGAMFSFNWLDSDTGRFIDGDWDKHELINWDDLYNETGLIAFESEMGTIWLGVNGAGYDFYDSHWAQLYDYMGFKWHSEEKKEE